LLLLLLLLLEQLLSSWLWCQAHLRDFLQPNFFQGFTRKYESHGDGLEPTATEMATGVVSAMGSNTRSSSGPATSLTGADLNKRLKRLNTEVCCYCYHTNEEADELLLLLMRRQHGWELRIKQQRMQCVRQRLQQRHQRHQAMQMQRQRH